VALVLLVLSHGPSFGQAFSYDSVASHYKGLTPWVKVLPDNGWDFEQAAALDWSQAPAYPAAADSLREGQAYWLRLEIESRHKKEAEWMLFLGPVDYLDAYLLAPGLPPRHLRSGLLVPDSLKAVAENRGKGSRQLVPIVLPGAREGEASRLVVLVRARNLAPWPIALDLWLQRPKDYKNDYDEFIARRNLLQGSFQGILWFTILFNLLLYFPSRDRTFLFHVFYMLFASLFLMNRFGLTQAWLTGRFPMAYYYLRALTPAMLGLFYLLFMDHYLYLRRRFPKITRLMFGMMALLVLDALAGVAILLASFDHALFDRMTNMVLLGVLLAASGILVYISRYKSRQSGFFILGSLMVGLAGSVYIFSMLEPRFVADKVLVFQFGIIGEVLLFTVGLIFRWNESERRQREMQERLIVQLKENQGLQQRANRELEAKVRERTAEIQQQKEEILSQRDYLELVNQELEQQKEEVMAQRDKIGQQKRRLELQHLKTLWQRDKIEEQNQHITDSIRYAQRIQKALLPPPEQIAEDLPESFIFFRPLHIVSGDFYWARRQGEHMALVAADSTGHGVPGAFMSMLGTALLNELAPRQLARKEPSPALLLAELRAKVIDALRQTGKSGENQDGFDMSVCFVHLPTGRLRWAGANNPLLVCRGPSLIELRPDRMPVGIFTLADTDFTEHSLRLRPRDCVYLFSDGFEDQFGGPEGKKFKSKPFRALVRGLAPLATAEQAEAFAQEFDRWKGSKFEQVDDVLLMGFRYKAP